MTRTATAQIARILSACGMAMGACTHAPQPVAPAIVDLEPPSAAPADSTALASSSEATSTSPASAPSVAATLDPSTCKARAAPSDASCKWTVAAMGRCGGAVIVHEPAPTPTCVCNGCDADSDCTARPHGKCETFFKVCAPSARACVYPGDACADGGVLCSKKRYTRPGNRTSEPEACAHDGHGHAVCGPRQSPPP